MNFLKIEGKAGGTKTRPANRKELVCRNRWSCAIWGGGGTVSASGGGRGNERRPVHVEL